MRDIEVYFTEINEEWDKEISKYNFDIYHLSGWINASNVIEEGKPQGIIAEYKEKKFFLPIIIREIDSEYWDAISPYGYGGPVIDKSLTHLEIDMILEEIKTFLYKAGCVSLFTRLNPILNKEWDSTIGTSVAHGFTLISDLSKSEDEHWKETQNQHRRGIKKALKMNIGAKIEDLSEQRIKVFSEIYRETMTKVGASEYYFFDDSYIYELANNLQDRLFLVTAYQDDNAIASSIYTICKESGIMQFYLGGTLNDYRNLQPSKLITHIAREWGRKNGYKVLHFGGGLGCSSDSLYEYKKGFSSQELEFKTWRLISNLEKYTELVIANNELTEVELESSFFPLYRDVPVHEQLSQTEEVVD
ncbi:peptidoglycan bridge formation glycyltransferase FemA/FemB family protein [Psychrobacter sp. 72-O-c]|uniref:peptidoglycan bridge formation glycyltransferase FemA/FemB family protein n=1 Tax=Psychrobacter sp. 72-O-c TaxID=2774125 RepID=UPI00191A71BB|nr:peptidoglycan bridge formation glycyltransferase FemA/FemB family protein [Psychrobacter sp. 72-O-c]